MELTPEEEKVILRLRIDKQRQEELKAKINFPRKIGYLKCSIYKNDGELYTEAERDEKVQECIGQFKCLALADTKMICYADQYGEKWYFDDDSRQKNKTYVFAEYMAKQCLRDIEEVK